MKSILLVGDGSEMEWVARCLGGVFTVGRVGHGAEYDDLSPPDVALVDALHPPHERWSADCAAVRAAFPGAPLLVLLASGAAEEQRRALAAGAVDWLADPMPVEGVRSRLTAYADHSAYVAGRGGGARDRALCEVIVDSISSGILVTDRELNVVFANPYVSRWSGWSREELLGSPLDAFCPPMAGRVRSGEVSGEVTCNFCSLDCYLGFRVFPLIGRPSRGPRGFIISFTDLSRIMELRRSLRLKERLTAMGEVVAKVAHEMRNPLFAVSGAAQLLVGELAVGEPHRKLLDSILAHTRRMNAVVQNLLDFTAEPKLEVVPFALDEAVSAAVENCKRLLGQLQVRVSVAAVPPVELWADRRQFLQALENLLRNAAEASGPGAEVTVEFDEEPAGMMNVRVCDRGCGAAADDLETLFELFYSGKHRGVGLGLPISRKIAEAHGGSLVASRREGGGLCFALHLPREGPHL